MPVIYVYFSNELFFYLLYWLKKQKQKQKLNNPLLNAKEGCAFGVT